MAERGKKAPDLLQRDLADLGRRHGLTGIVLIAMDSEKWHQLSWGQNHWFMTLMDGLGGAILTDIDDGRYDGTASDAVARLPAGGSA